MMDTCYYTVDQMHKIYNTKSELQRKLWTLDAYDISTQARQFKQMSHSGGDVDNGGGYAASIWETSVPSPQFCCEPKTPL